LLLVCCTPLPGVRLHRKICMTAVDSVQLVYNGQSVAVHLRVRIYLNRHRETSTVAVNTSNSSVTAAAAAAAAVAGGPALSASNKT
jgi:hypothetical protein